MGGRISGTAECGCAIERECTAGAASQLRLTRWAVRIARVAQPAVWRSARTAHLPAASDVSRRGSTVGGRRDSRGCSCDCGAQAQGQEGGAGASHGGGTMEERVRGTISLHSRGTVSGHSAVAAGKGWVADCPALRRRLRPGSIEGAAGPAWQAPAAGGDTCRRPRLARSCARLHALLRAFRKTPGATAARPGPAGTSEQRTYLSRRCQA